MRSDDPDPKRPLAHEVGSDLAAISVDELRQRVVLMEQEIVRLQEEVRRKLASREAAGSVFKF